MLHFNRRACCLVIAGAFLILIVIGVYRSLNAKVEAAVPVTGVQSEAVRPTAAPGADTGHALQPSDFYRTIIDNNLFCPLGWPPSVPLELCRLLGPIFPRDSKMPPKRLLRQQVAPRHTLSL